MDIKIPKKSPESLLKRVQKVANQIKDGTAKLRKTERYGYWTIALGHCERAVLIDTTLYIFNKHREYEKFINAKR